ncbi:MAG: hypothetical protein C4K49_12340 [Candidatus Thorarchaeota archaeon]|nr:MAG: hypothetical protein C4K49_12340 [Candidatus Thorarchaeota archaeon]
MRAAALILIVLMVPASVVSVFGPLIVPPSEHRRLAFYSSSNDSPHSIILMIGDGMGYDHVRLGTWVEAGETDTLFMAGMNNSLSATTHNVDHAVTDSAAAATAIGTGFKTYNGRLAMGPSGEVLESILEIAEAMNKSTGVVSTTEIQHATPAAFLTHVLSRSDYGEITRQIVEQTNVDVIMGGGRSYFSSQQLEDMQSNGFTLVTNRSGLMSVTDGKVLGLFADGHVGYEQYRDCISTPSLAEMTEKAIDVLSMDPEGFFLMVEGGMIDQGAHANSRTDVALETIAFDRAVKTALNYVYTDSHAMLIVVADHETGGLSTTSATLNDELPAYGNTEEYNRSLRISRALNVSTSWSTTAHTGENVPIFQQGRLPRDWIGLETIDNTDVFHAMSAYLSLDLAHEETGPVVRLNSPSNGSIVKPFSLIDLNISDPGGVDVVLYHWDVIENDTLVPPYDLLARTSQVAHWLYVYAIDFYENWATAVFVFTTDGIVPSVALFTPSNNTMHHSGATVAVNVTDAHLTDVLYHWDAEAANVTWCSPYETVLPLGNGLHVLYVYANDSAGNLASSRYVLIAHDGPPIVSLLSPLNATVVRSGQTVFIDVVDQEMDTVLYAWDNVTNYAQWSSPFETSAPSGDRTHSLYVWANNSHAISAEVRFDFDVDDTIPQLTLISPSNLSVCIAGTEVIVGVSDEHLAAVLLRWDDAEYNSTFYPPYVTQLPLSDGTHTLMVYAQDAAGNYASIRVFFLADNTRPSMILMGPDNGTVVRTEGGITLDISDAHLSHVWFSWDDGSNVTLEYPFRIAFPAGDGWHRLSVVANDTAGNLLCRTFVWTVDDTAPVIANQEGFTMRVGEIGRNVSWRAEDLSPAYYQVLVNGSPWSSGRWNSSSDIFVIILDGFSIGAYNLTLVLEDRAGNRASNTVVVVVESTVTTSTTSTSTTSISSSITSETPTPTTPTNDSLIVIITLSIGILFAGLVVGGFVLIRSRGSTSERTVLGALGSVELKQSFCLD